MEDCIDSKGKCFCIFRYIEGIKKNCTFQLTFATVVFVPGQFWVSVGAPYFSAIFSGIGTGSQKFSGIFSGSSLSTSESSGVLRGSGLGGKAKSSSSLQSSSEEDFLRARFRFSGAFLVLLRVLFSCSETFFSLRV